MGRMSPGRKAGVEMNDHLPFTRGQNPAYRPPLHFNFLAETLACDRIRKTMRRWFLLTLVAGGLFVGGCASGTSYLKPGAPWKTIQKVGVFPFAAPYEDRVRREWYTQVFVTELRRTKRFEVVELPPPPVSVGLPDYGAVAHKEEVDAYIVATVEDLAEIFADVKLVDAATGETLWSIRYNRGGGLELSFRFQTSQQQLQRIYRIIVRKLLRDSRRR